MSLDLFDIRPADNSYDLLLMWLSSLTLVATASLLILQESSYTPFPGMTLHIPTSRIWHVQIRFQEPDVHWCFSSNVIRYKLRNMSIPTPDASSHGLPFPFPLLPAHVLVTSASMVRVGFVSAEII